MREIGSRGAGGELQPVGEALENSAAAGRAKRPAFTLIELLVAMTVFAVVLGLVFSVITQASATSRRSFEKVQAFQDARTAFDTMTRYLSQATLNTYLDYDNATNASRYLRKSELKFLIGAAGDAGIPGTAGTGGAVFFQTPAGYTTNSSFAGMESLLVTCGYFVSFNTNSAVPGHTVSLKNPYRYRLMQMLVPTENNLIYRTNVTPNAWFENFSNLATPIADNVIALILRPQDPASEASELPNNGYGYDSTADVTADPQPVTANQLPPVVLVTMVAIDETSAKRIEAGTGQPPEIASALSGKFANPADYQADLDALVAGLGAQRITCRVFSSAVPLRESKWSK